MQELSALFNRKYVRTFICCLSVIPGFCCLAFQISSVHTRETSQTASLNRHFVPGFPFFETGRVANWRWTYFFSTRILWEKKQPCSAGLIIQPAANSISRLRKCPQTTTVHLLPALQASISTSGATQLPSPSSGRLAGHSQISVCSVVWQPLHSIIAARTPTTITPTADAVLQAGRYLVLCTFWQHAPSHPCHLQPTTANSVVLILDGWAFSLQEDLTKIIFPITE